MPTHTLAEFLNSDLNIIIEKNPDVAALFKAIVNHSVSHAKEKRKYFIDISPVHCDDEGRCIVRFNYR